MPGDVCLPLRMRDIITGFSRGMFSNWLWYRPLQVLVDAGEGINLALGARVHAPTHLLVTHGHSDHILGMPGLIASRRFSLGAHEFPLTVMYPTGSPAIDVVKHALARLYPKTAFPVVWIPTAAGAEHPLDRTRRITVFASRHPAMEAALGYRILEQRRRLKPELAGLPQEEIRRRALAEGRDGLMEDYSQVLFAHTGDSMPLDPALFRDADILVHDATFLEQDDRRADIHATTTEAMALAREARVRALVLHHVSIRYPRDGLMGRLREQLSRSGYAGECWLLDEGDLRRVEKRKSDRL